MNYKDLIRKVHPDLNPNVHDAGAKISMIMENKHDPVELMALAISWGLVPNPGTKTFVERWIIFNFVFHGENFTKGTKIRFSDVDGKYHEAWYVYKTRGTVYFTNKVGIFTVKCSLEKLSGKMEFSEISPLTPMELSLWETKVDTLRGKVRKIPTVKTPKAKPDASFYFEKWGMKMNHQYMYEKSQVRYKGNYYKLWLTDGQYAFIVINGSVKRIQMKFVEDFKNS